METKQKGITKFGVTAPFPLSAILICIMLLLAASAAAPVYNRILDSRIGGVPGLHSASKIVESYNKTQQVKDKTALPIIESEQSKWRDMITYFYRFEGDASIFEEHGHMELEIDVTRRKDLITEMEIRLLDFKGDKRPSQLTASMITFLMVLEETDSYQEAERMFAQISQVADGTTFGEKYQGKYFTYQVWDPKDKSYPGLHELGMDNEQAQAVDDLEENARGVLMTVVCLLILLAMVAWTVASARAHGIKPGGQVLLLLLPVVGIIFILLRLSRYPMEKEIQYKSYSPKTGKRMVWNWAASWCYGITTLLLMVILTVIVVTTSPFS